MDRRTCTQISAKLMLLPSHVCVNCIRNVSYIKICVNKMSEQIDVFKYKTGKIPTYLDALTHNGSIALFKPYFQVEHNA